jgi:hypothetical protein
LNELKGAAARGGDVFVGAHGPAGQLDVQLVGDGLDAMDALGRLLGRILLRVGKDVAGQGDEALLDAEADVGFVDARLALQFVLRVAF